MNPLEKVAHKGPFLSQPLVLFLPNPLHVALFLTELCLTATEKGSRASALVGAAYAIRWAYQLAGLDSPIDNHVIKSCLKGAKRKLGRPVQPKEVLSLGVVVRIWDQYYGSSLLADLRFLLILFQLG